MFYYCSSLASLDLSGWDASKVTSMKWMFYDCSSLSSLDLSGWDVSSVTDMFSVFRGCSSLTSLDLSGWDVSSVTSMSYMFYHCDSLASLDLSGWDTSKVTSMNEVFSGCSELATLDLSDWDVSSVTDMSSVFRGCSELATLDLSDWDVSSVTDMSSVFGGCSSLTSLGLSDWNTSSVTDMSSVFGGCSQLSSLDLSDWNTSSVTDMYGVFYGCTSLTSLDLTGWDTSKVTDMRNMFFGCSSLTSLDLSDWDVSSVTFMFDMFRNCTSLTSLDLSGWDASSVTTMEGMFTRCYKLTSIDLTGWDTSKVKVMRNMFDGCSSLTSLDLSGWNTSSVTDASYMFNGCGRVLERVKVGDGFTLRRCLPSYTINGFSGWYSEALNEVDAPARLLGGIADTYTKGKPSGTVDLSEAVVTIEGAFEYDGTDKRPLPKVVLGGTELLPRDDYWVSYQNNIDGGTATVIIHGWGEYRGECTATFAISCIPISRAVVAEIGDETYNGSEHRPEPKVTLDGTALKKDIDYTLSYASNTNAGTATVTVTGKGNYAGSVTSGFEIAPAAIDVPASGDLEYDGTEQVGIGPVEGCELSGTYAASHVGTYIAIVKPDANHLWADGSTEYREVRWSIAPRPVTVTAEDKVKECGERDPVFTAKVDGLIGDEHVAYTLARDSGEGIGVYEIKPSGDAEQGDYVVAYVQGKLTIARIDLSVAEVRGVVNKTWDGSAATQQLTVGIGDATLTEGDDYELSYANNTDVGTATVTVTGKGNYTGEKTVEFTIAPALVERPAAIEGLVYDGAPHEGVQVPGGCALVSGETSATDAGDYVATVAPDSNHAWSDGATGEAELRWSIAPAQVEKPAATEGLVYDGAPHEGVAVPGGCVLVSGVTSATDAGGYAATVAPDSNHAWSDGTTGEAELRWSIAPRPVTVIARDESKAYGMDDPELTATSDGLLGDDSVACSISREPGNDAGEYAITPSGDARQGNYTVTYVSGKLTITPLDLSETEVDPIEAQLCTGEDITPKPVVRMGNRTLVEGTDYDLSYADNVEAGTGKVTITGKGNYEGSKVAEFRIGATRLSDANIWLECEMYAASQVPARPAVTAILYGEYDGNGYQERPLAEGTDYEVTYLGGDTIGPAVAVVTGLGEFVGTVELPYEVAARVDVSRWVPFKLEEGVAVYRGTPVRPAVTLVHAGPQWASLKEGVDYTVSYLSNDRPGTGLVVITGIGEFTGERVLPFRLLAPSEVTITEDDIDFEFEEPTAYGLATVGGKTKLYPLYLSRDGSAPRPHIGVRLWVDGADGKGTWMRLTEGVDYRAEWISSSGGSGAYDAGGMVIFGIGGITGDAMATYLYSNRIDIAELYLGAKDLDSDEYLYEGTPVKPRLERAGLIEGTDYRLSYSGNTSPGTCVVTVYGMGCFYGTATIEVPVVAEHTLPQLDTCALTFPDDLMYTGSPVEPQVTLRDPATGEELEEGYDYVVTFSNNVESGTATAHVRRGYGGRYGGFADVEFRIAKAPSAVSAHAKAATVSCRYAPSSSTQTTANVAASGASGRIAYSNASLDAMSARFTVDSATGAVSVPAGTQPGTYQVRVRASDAGDANHKAGEAYAAYQLRVDRSTAFSVAAPASQTYTGRALTPKPTVRDGSYTLREGTDYTLSYANNVNAGTATVTVSGKGNYTGSKSATFRIVAPPAPAPAPAPTPAPAPQLPTPHISYRTHVQRIGWQRYVSDGEMSGTSGRSFRLEGINIRLSDLPCAGGIQYRTHVQRIGWQGWRRDDAMAGTKGKSYRLEAIEIKLYGEMEQRYDVYYRVHCQRFGWMGWAKNGQRSGSAGYSRRLEGIQIVLVPKDQPGPGPTCNGITQRFAAPFKQKGKK